MQSISFLIFPPSPFFFKPQQQIGANDGACTRLLGFQLCKLNPLLAMLCGSTSLITTPTALAAAAAATWDPITHLRWAAPSQRAPVCWRCVEVLAGTRCAQSTHPTAAPPDLTPGEKHPVPDGTRQRPTEDGAKAAGPHGLNGYGTRLSGNGPIFCTAMCAGTLAGAGSTRLWGHIKGLSEEMRGTTQMWHLWEKKAAENVTEIATAASE